MDGDGAAIGGPRREKPLASSVLVLNKHYTAVRVVQAKRAFSLLFKNNAEVIDHSEGRFVNFNFDGWIGFSQSGSNGNGELDQFVRTPRYQIKVPRVIRLTTYDKIPKREVKFSRRNILSRDGHCCQYCGRKFSVSSLSVDHIVPKSRGGRSSWTNVVTACNPCNTRKGGRLPSEAGMKLLKKPAAPRRNPFVSDKLTSDRYRIWKYFVSDKEMSVDGQ